MHHFFPGTPEPDPSSVPEATTCAKLSESLNQQQEKTKIQTLSPVPTNTLNTHTPPGLQESRLGRQGTKKEKYNLFASNRYLLVEHSWLSFSLTRSSRPSSFISSYFAAHSLSVYMYVRAPVFVASGLRRGFPISSFVPLEVRVPEACPPIQRSAVCEQTSIPPHNS